MNGINDLNYPAALPPVLINDHPYDDPYDDEGREEPISPFVPFPGLVAQRGERLPTLITPPQKKAKIDADGNVIPRVVRIHGLPLPSQEWARPLPDGQGWERKAEAPAAQEIIVQAPEQSLTDRIISAFRSTNILRRIAAICVLPVTCLLAVLVWTVLMLLAPSPAAGEDRQRVEERAQDHHRTVCLAVKKTAWWIPLRIMECNPEEVLYAAEPPAPAQQEVRAVAPAAPEARVFNVGGEGMGPNHFERLRNLQQQQDQDAVIQEGLEAH